MLGKNRSPPIKPIIIDTRILFSLFDALKKLKKMETAAAQQNRSASRNKYNMLNPFEAIKKVIMHKDIVISLAIKLKFLLVLIILLPSTIIKLEIAFKTVSMLLIVSDIANRIITMEITKLFSSKIKEKKDKSGIT